MITPGQPARDRRPTAPRLAAVECRFGFQGPVGPCFLVLVVKFSRTDLRVALIEEIDKLGTKCPQQQDVRN